MKGVAIISSFLWKILSFIGKSFYNLLYKPISVLFKSSKLFGKYYSRLWTYKG